MAQIVWHAYISGHISGKKVADLGCGTGVFCLAISLLNGYCTCIEIDLESLEVVRNLKYELGLEMDLINADATNFTGKFDTVIQNPPFGVVRRGIDLEFLKSAFNIANVIYSIHKSNTKSREIIANLAKENGFKAEVISERYKLKPYYPWHREKIYEYLVDIYFFSKLSR
ncbi:METTL5 family protein [Sulfolobus tengchongensis]|uniref:Methyltransferase-like protein 5 n=1 Tax=Sulfolobus tengchongensis TaxID=207809 RepID=A0AAX4L2Y0_9CREN